MDMKENNDIATSRIDQLIKQKFFNCISLIF